MDNSAKIEYKGKTYTFPVITGSENEEAIDIKNLGLNLDLLPMIQDIKIQVIV